MSKRSRQIAVLFRMNEVEHRHLKEQVKLSGLTKEQYIRNLIAGVEIRTRPPDELPELLHQLSAIGNNINQIARATNARDFVREAEIAAIKEQLSAIWKAVKNL